MSWPTYLSAIAQLSIATAAWVIPRRFQSQNFEDMFLREYNEDKYGEAIRNLLVFQQSCIQKANLKPDATLEEKQKVVVDAYFEERDKHKFSYQSDLEKNEEFRKYMEISK